MLNLLKKMSLLLPLVLFSGQAQSTSLCSDPFHQTEVCERMRYLKASLNLFDGQRELVQVNYPYLAAVSSSMISNIDQIFKVIVYDIEGHLKSLKDLQTYLKEAEALANRGSIDVVINLNSLKSNCASCHAPVAPPSGVPWGDVFYYDWETVTKNCNKNGGNPFICRNMNGLLTAYSHLLTQTQAKIEDFKTIKLNGLEILRIFGEMKKANAFHMKPEFVEAAVASAQELVKLADANDPSVADHVYNMANVCSSCHTDFGHKFGGSKQLFNKVW